jgi:hypothetical protein
MCPDGAHTLTRAPSLTNPGAERTPLVHRFQPSEGVFLYMLGLVIVGTHPGRFWLGITLSVIPLVIGPLGRAFGG